MSGHRTYSGTHIVYQWGTAFEAGRFPPSFYPVPDPSLYFAVFLTR
jgi:hypothetical protein